MTENKKNILIMFNFIISILIVFLIMKFIKIELEEFRWKIFFFIGISIFLLFGFLVIKAYLKVEKLIFNIITGVSLLFNFIATILCSIFYKVLFSRVSEYIIINTILLLVSSLMIITAYIISSKGSSRDVTSK